MDKDSGRRYNQFICQLDIMVCANILFVALSYKQPNDLRKQSIYEFFELMNQSVNYISDSMTIISIKLLLDACT